MTAVDRQGGGACGVLVDGQIYITVEDAAEVATSGSTVTLLHDSTETVELANGVILETNNFTAAGVTVADPAPAHPIMVTYKDGTVAYFDNILDAVPFKTNYDLVEGATITLLSDYTGSGIRFCENDMVLDLNEFTYTVNEGTGSNTTRTSAFQIRPEVTTTTTIKNGTIKIAVASDMHESYGSIAYMINNYAAKLVMEDVVMDMTNMTWSYGTSVYAVVSRAEDTVELTGTTSVTNFNEEIGGAMISNGGDMTIADTASIPGTVELSVGATLTASEDVNVVTDDNAKVVYNNGTYTAVAYVAMIGEVGYTTLAEAFANVTDGDTITIIGEVNEGTIKLPATLKNVTVKGEVDGVIKDTIIMTHDGNTLSYEGITFKNLVFDNSNLVFTGWRTGDTTFKDFTITGCTFKNIVRSDNTAAIHINVDASSEAFENFTFTNNVIDGVSGGNNSGIYMAGTGALTFTGNVINNVAFRPILLQLADCDGVVDAVKVENNTFSGSSVGRLQIYGTEVDNGDGTWTPTGTDTMEFAVTGNIFKDITNAQQICTWGINAETVDISKNYYDIDITQNPSAIYWNNITPTDEAGLKELGVFPIYTELNEDGTINTESAYTPVLTYVAQVGETKYESLADAIAALKTNGGTLALLDNVSESITLNYPEDGAPTELTIDLNGFTVTSAESTLWVSDGYVVTVKDSSEAKTGKVISTAANGEAIAIARGGKVILESGYVYNDAYAVYLYSGGSTGNEAFVMNGGTVEVPNGGTAIAVGAGKATINGGKVLCNKQIGGEGWNTYVYSGATLVITGGEFLGTIGKNTDSVVSISGGTFSYCGGDDDGFRTEHLAPGYTTKTNDDGSISVYELPETNEDGFKWVSTYEELVAALENDNAKVIMANDITGTATQNSGYGVAGIVLDAGDILDGNGNKLTINGANTKWDCAIAMRGGEVRNLTIAGAMRGVFMPGANGDVLIDNCKFENVVYTFNSDAGSENYTVTIKNTALNGWTSFSAVHKAVTFEECTFAEGSGYAYCRPYQATTFENCDFAEGYEFDAVKTEPNSLTFNGCTYNEEPLSAENGLDMFYAGGQVRVDDQTVDYTRYAKIERDGETLEFTSLAKAIDAAQGGETVTLLADVALNAPITIKKSITIDGNGKTITQSAECNNSIALLYFEGAEGAKLNVTVKNVTFDGLKTGAAIRTLHADMTIDNVVFQNCEHTVGQGLVRLTKGSATIKNSQFLNNNCSMGVSFNWDTAGNADDTLTVDNCVFTGNTANKTALIYYVKGAGCTIKNSEFTGNNVNCADNGAVIYLGFQDKCVVTGNLFKDNVVTEANTSTRVAGAIFAGYQAEITGNALINNTASNSIGSALGQICISTYYEEGKIVLDENYWGGNDPVAGKDYTVQHQTGTATLTLDNYNASYTTDENGNVVVSELVAITYVAQISGKTPKYESLQAAIAAAQDGETVTLLDNVTLEETIEIPAGKTVTLDLNSKTIDVAYTEGSTTNHIYAFTNNGTLTITGNGVINTRGIFNYGNMTLENGTINAIDGNGGYGVRNYEGSTFTMKGGTIATTYEDDNKVDEGGYDATTVRVDKGATFVMNGGVLNNICDFTFAIENHGTTTIEGGKVTSVHTTVANYGTLTINDGEFNSNGLEGITAHVVWAAAGTTVINGGTFDGKDNYNGFNVDASAGAVVTITGGKFLAVHSGSLYGEGTIAVSGGIFFDAVPEDRCAAGYEPKANGDGTYGVDVAENVVATVVDANGTVIGAYDTVAAALNAATDGTTIVMQKDATEEGGVVCFTAGVTLDLNGKILTAGYVIFANGNDVIDSSSETTGVIATEHFMVGKDNEYLPIYDSAVGGYRLFQYSFENLGTKDTASTTSQKYGVTIRFANPDAYGLIAASEEEVIGVRVTIQLSGSINTNLYHDFSYDTIKKMATAYQTEYSKNPAYTGTKAMTLTISGLDRLPEGYVMTVRDVLTSGTGINLIAEAD